MSAVEDRSVSLSPQHTPSPLTSAMFLQFGDERSVPDVYKLTLPSVLEHSLPDSRSEPVTRPIHDPTLTPQR